MDAWAFVAEPHNLADWWPALAAVEPDRRGLAEGARWHVRRTARPTLFRAGGANDLLLARRVEPPRWLAFHFVAERLDAELELEPAAAARTRARLMVSSPLLVAFRRSLPRQALERLHTLCQTAGGL